MQSTMDTSCNVHLAALTICCEGGHCHIGSASAATLALRSLRAAQMSSKPAASRCLCTATLWRQLVGASLFREHARVHEAAATPAGGHCLCSSSAMTSSAGHDHPTTDQPLVPHRQRCGWLSTAAAGRVPPRAHVPLGDVVSRAAQRYDLSTGLRAQCGAR